MAESRSESVQPPKIENLTARERELVEAARRGEPLVCAPGMDVEELAESGDPKHRVRAELVRELLLGHHGELDPRGIRLGRARIVGSLDLDHLRTTTPLSLSRCAIAEPFTARNARLNRLDLTGSRLPGLRADRLRVDGNLILRQVRVRGRATDGAVRLLGTHISGNLDCDDIEITNDTGPALDIERVRVSDNLFLRRARMRGSSKNGAMDLLAAHISGSLECDDIEITNDAGRALYADRLRVGDNLFLRRARVRGSGAKGAVDLLAAHIGGSLECDDAEITNDTGPALYADRLRVDHSLFLRKAHLRGNGINGVVHLLSAHINGQLSCTGLHVDNPSGPVLDLEKAHVQDIMLPINVVCPHSTRGAYCGHPTEVDLNEFVFTTFGRVDWRQWLHLIAHHTRTYRPQPYQQLAAIERAAGHDGNARRVLIAQQDDLRRRDPSAIGGRGARAVHRLWGWLAGYGYRARTLAVALLLVLTAAGATGYIAGQVSTRPDHHAAERVIPPGTSTLAPGTRCSTVELIGLGLDRGLPLGATGLRAKCDLDTATRRGGAFTLVIWLIQAMLWGLITLAVAGYTALIRKTT